MADEKKRSTVGFRPTVVRWLSREKTNRQLGDLPDGLEANGDLASRDLITNQAVVLLSHVQSTRAMKSMFGKEGPTIRRTLLEYLSTHKDPSE